MSAGGLPFSLNDLGGLPANLTGAAQVNLGILGQAFQTTNVVNTKRAVYQLSIRSPGEAKTAVTTFTFPLSPSALRRTYMAKANVWDTAGPVASQGVSRTIDRYGMAPPTFIIEGTTGWQRHSMDGFVFTGMEAISNLLALLNKYAELNRGQILAGNSQTYTMEFYDYFFGEFWQVEPVGEQRVMQDARRPLLFSYMFRLEGVRKLDQAPVSSLSPDALLSALTQGVSQAASKLFSAVGDVLTNYPPAPVDSDLLDVG